MAFAVSSSKQRSCRYCCMLTKCMEKKLDGHYKKMLRAILNKFWRQHPSQQQLCGHLQLITKTIQVRRTTHAGHSWRRRDELISDVLLYTPSQDVQLEPTYNNSVPIQNVALQTCRKRWTIERGSKKGSGISVLMARPDDDDDDKMVKISFAFF